MNMAQSLWTDTKEKSQVVMKKSKADCCWSPSYKWETLIDPKAE